jgi:hypothetical protein
MLSYSDAAYVCFESYLGFLLLYVLVIPAALYHFSSVFGIGVLITMEYLISLSALPALSSVDTVMAVQHSTCSFHRSSYRSSYRSFHCPSAALAFHCVNPL